MSAADHVRAARRLEPGTLLILTVGIGTLLTRTRLTALTTQGRGVALALLAGAVLAGSLLTPVPLDRGPARLSRGAGLAIGLAGVVLATVVSGPIPPLPFPWWALPLSILAAVAEEALFRRVGYAWLARWGAPAAMAGSAIAFALFHVPLYGVAVLPVDLGAGLLLGWQRWATGTWTVPAATHGVANAIATVLR